MKHKMTVIWFSVLLGALLTCSAAAGVREMLLCLPGFPGTAGQAQPFVDKMLRYLEGRMGWEAGSMSGLYVPDGTRGLNELTTRKPGLALVGPSIYAAGHHSLKMKVIAQVEVNGRGKEIYSVITRVDGPSSLAELRGKTMTGTVAHDPRYVHNVLLNQILPMGELTLKAQKRPLKALRDVARGKAAAALVDESVRQHMSELDFADELRVIHTSAPVPSPAVVVMGENTRHAAALAEVLVGLCGRPDGAELCHSLTLSAIRRATDADYRNLLKRYRP